MFQSKEEKWKKPVHVQPVRNIEEIHTILEMDRSKKVNTIYLVLRRLSRGSELVPKNLVARCGIHLLMGDESLFLLKIFNGNEHGYLRIEDEEDKAKVREVYEELATLEEAPSLLSSEVYGRVRKVELNTSLDIGKVRSSRNLLDSPENPTTMVDCEYLADSLFPNPESQKSGSLKSDNWARCAGIIVNLLKGKATSIDDFPIPVRDLVDDSILVPVSGIEYETNSAILKVYKSDVKVIIHSPASPLKHDGGIIIFKLFPNGEAWTAKRMLRVLSVPGNERNLKESPHTPRIYHSWTDQLNSDHKKRVKVFEDLDKEEGVFRDIPFLLAGLSALGEVDSSFTKFNSIVGLNSMGLII